ncbi:endonuclease/exonuclease/phosphatase family protein [Flaviflexus huanghaiensis]|uniref:endonuclease/exonuclease/phosphatase family protein n=1 Tax=Flaviflexus huanghaiensis TaxID=1111473 RepID=UPI0015F93404|nr:endonuclease/exonuclease/phosphatase family protein [Flaviflexus huanghaiensis]
MKYLYAMLVIIGLAIVAVTLDPSLVPYDGSNLALTYPISQMIAMRGIVAAVLATLGFIFALIAIVRALMLRKGFFLAVFGLGLIAVAAGHVAILADRGLDAGRMPPDRGLTHVSQGTGELTVMSYNTLGGETTMDDLLPIVLDTGVDVIVLTETSTQNGERLANLLGNEGRPFTIFHSDADPYDSQIKSTVVLVSGALGEYRQGPNLGLTWGSVHIRSVAGGPDIIAVHPVAPVGGLADTWLEEITAVYEQCDTMTNTIMAGDFNSTIDHMHATGASCTSALDGTVGGYGTWPASVPGILGSPIDNVYTDWETRAAAIIDVGGSDHRGVLVRLAQ